MPGGDESYILRHNISATQGFTLNVWVRFQKGVQASLLSLYNANETGGYRTFLTISHDSIRLNGEVIAFNKTIADGYWHYVAVAVNTIKAHRRVILNDKTLAHNDVERLRNKTFFHPTGTLAVGLEYDSVKGRFVDSGFAGQISQLSISHKRYVNEMYNCSYNFTSKSLCVSSYFISLIMESEREFLYCQQHFISTRPAKTTLF